jgi:valyl-tRNA synthetase
MRQNLPFSDLVMDLSRPASLRFGQKSCSMTLELTFLQPTGSESLAEKWILHKLNTTAAEVNRYLAERNFMMATNTIYNFWLYELCDVYIVCLVRAYGH